MCGLGGGAGEVITELRLYPLGPSKSLEITSSSQPSAGQSGQRRATQLTAGQHAEGGCPVGQ